MSMPVSSIDFTWSTSVQQARKNSRVCVEMFLLKIASG
eukprot:CAMPEP_0195041774 /NCGR_PEP_ID=MMETSP0347-20130606/1289_1 /TAXON_ID=2932 /ORGANISM="Alexandrium fundyense, Strain CCMP1719" /LENGTH=37 /DNA_ID= /DNA_START= /DNA_END= /DNA_ORIENTATION=